MVLKVGNGVTTRKVGDRVGVPWLQSTCGRCEWCQRGKLFFCPNHIATGINIAKAVAAKVKKSTGQPQDAFIAIVVFAAEYRSAGETVHQNHADMWFSRTGVARVGTADLLYEDSQRGFLTFDDVNEHAFHTAPVWANAIWLSR